MSKLPIFVSGTIVLFFCCQSSLASPQHVAPESKEASEEWPATPADENMSISQPPEVTGPSAAPSARYYSYRQQLTFRAGAGADLSNLSETEPVIGFQYLFPKFLSPKFEAGADLHEKGKGHIHAGVRWIFSERSYFRPSVKASVDNLVNSKQNLATFTKLGNYYARGSAALEYVFWNPYSVRLEPEVMVSVEDIKVVVTLGVSRGW